LVHIMVGWLSRLGAPGFPSVGTPGTPNVTTHWRDAPLDHFDFSEERTFKQRYFLHDSYWSGPDGPILFYTGNEANVELYINSTGLMWERAAELGALLVFAEHRYYGESLPFGGQAEQYNASALRWLTLEQALADYATLIYDLKRRLNATRSPVVALGGSYGGMLAAWLRMHYPSAVVGALAASAPVVAFDGLLTGSGAAHWDGNAYWQVVTADASVSAGAAAGCVDGVRATWPRLFSLAQSAAGRAKLTAAFALCAPLGPSDASRLASQLLNVWDTLAMGNFPYASNYLIYQQTRGTLRADSEPRGGGCCCARVCVCVAARACACACGCAPLA